MLGLFWWQKIISDQSVAHLNMWDKYVGFTHKKNIMRMLYILIYK